MQSPAADSLVAISKEWADKSEENGRQIGLINGIALMNRLMVRYGVPKTLEIAGQLMTDKAKFDRIAATDVTAIDALIEELFPQ